MILPLQIVKYVMYQIHSVVLMGKIGDRINISLMDSIVVLPLCEEYYPLLKLQIILNGELDRNFKKPRFELKYN